MVKLAWRNLWRNTRRTLITLTALVLGSAAIVVAQSYRESMYSQMIQTLTEQLVGHLQVHGHGYQESPELENFVHDPAQVEATLAGVLPGVRSEKRILGAGLGGSGDSSAGVAVMGIEPKAGTNLVTIAAGHGLTENGGKQVVLGSELARELGLKVGDELVLVGQAVDGSVANDRFTVVGLGDAGSSELNATAVFLELAQAQDFFGMGAGVTELVLHLPTDEEDVSQPLAAARAALDLRTLEALSWNELLPELRNTIEAKRSGGHGIDFVVFLIVSLGVLNAMTMSTFERTREFGVMMSIGARPGRVLRLVLTEAVLQGLLGFVVGLVLAQLILLAMGTIHLGGLAQGDMMGVRLPETVHIRFYLPAVWSAAVTVFSTMLLGGLVPAFRASRLRPVEAVRAD